MRHCINENVQVYEAEGNNLADLYREVASQLDALDGNYVSAETKVVEGYDGNRYLVLLNVS
jgi:hypothetical protein